MQIPHFSDEVLKHCKKGKQTKIQGLSDWLNKPEDRKGLKDMSDDKILDMEAFCNHISQVEIKPSIAVEGEEDGYICMGDIATVAVGLPGRIWNKTKRWAQLTPLSFLNRNSKSGGYS